MADPDRPQKGFFRSLLRILINQPSIPKNLENNPLMQLIMGRRSIRHFSREPVPEDSIKVILEAGRMAPSAVNLQTWTFIQFSPQDWQDVFGRSIPFKGQLAIMVLSDTHRMRLLIDEYGFPDESLTLHTISVFNAGLSAMNMTLAAEACGLSSIMLSETGQTGLLDVGMLRDKLALPKGVTPLTTIIFGYRRKGLSPVPPRLPMEMICGKAAYPQPDTDALYLWLADMRTGYRAMRPWKSFDAQVETYQTKMSQAEKVLRENVLNQK